MSTLVHDPEGDVLLGDNEPLNFSTSKEALIPFHPSPAYTRQPTSAEIPKKHETKRQTKNSGWVRPGIEPGISPTDPLPAQLQNGPVPEQDPKIGSKMLAR